jgi:hypothetical protein
MNKFFRFSILSLFGLSSVLSGPSQATLVNPKTLLSKKQFSVCFLLDGSIIDRQKVAFNHETKKEFVKKGFIFRTIKLIDVPVSYEKEGIIPFPEEIRNDIKNAVNGSVGPVGFTFSGWQDCDPDHLSDLILIYSKASDSTLMTGTSGEVRKNFLTGARSGKRYNTIRINSGFLENEIKSSMSELSKFELKYHLTIPKEELSNHWAKEILLKSIVHETGHFLGLHHEHMRIEGYTQLRDFELDTKKDNFSTLVLVNSLLEIEYAKRGRTFDDFYQSHGEYDIFSTMNYMWLFNTDRALQLKLYCTYVKNPENNPDICNMAFIDMLLPQFTPETGYFSKQDIAGLRYYYSGEDAPASTLDEQAQRENFWNWMIKIKEMDI